MTAKRHELLSKGNRKAFPTMRQKPQFWHKICGNVLGFWYNYILTGIIRLEDENQNIWIIHLFSERPSYIDLVISSDLLEIYL